MINCDHYGSIPKNDFTFFNKKLLKFFFSFLEESEEVEKKQIVKTGSQQKMCQSGSDRNRLSSLFAATLFVYFLSSQSAATPDGKVLEEKLASWR